MANTNNFDQFQSDFFANIADAIKQAEQTMNGTDDGGAEDAAAEETAEESGLKDTVVRIAHTLGNITGGISFLKSLKSCFNATDEEGFCAGIREWNSRIEQRVNILYAYGNSDTAKEAMALSSLIKGDESGRGLVGRLLSGMMALNNKLFAYANTGKGFFKSILKVLSQLFDVIINAIVVVASAAATLFGVIVAAVMKFGSIVKKIWQEASGAETEAATE